MSRISFEGFDNKYATFESSGTIKVGDLVSINNSGKIVAAVEDDALFGVCVNKRDSIVTVQLGGYAEVPTDGNITDYGTVKIIYDSDGNAVPGEATDIAPCVKVVHFTDDYAGIIF